MTREQFVEKHRHFFGGLVLDAATAQRTGADLALSIRKVMAMIDVELGSAYDEMNPPLPMSPAVNGKAVSPVPQVRR